MKYNEIEMEIIRLSMLDIIRTSPTGDGNDNGWGGGAGGFTPGDDNELPLMPTK